MNSMLFTPTQLGSLSLKNHIVMAPMTRSRAIRNIPNELMALYYHQRADAGLIITEGTSPSPNGLGYSRIPGLFNQEQVQGWQEVTDGVHQAGSKMFVQLMHTGRVSHPANMPAGARVLAPSAIAVPGEVWTDSDGMQPYPVPQEMSETDIAESIAEYVASAKLAIRAGVDGVELHAANGYLIDQFLNTASNQRQDRWVVQCKIVSASRWRSPEQLSPPLGPSVSACASHPMGCSMPRYQMPRWIPSI